MKKIFFLLIFSFLGVFINAHDSKKVNPINDKDYYKQARVNESPKGITFNEVFFSSKFSASNTDNYVVKYTEDYNKKGTYLKVYFNEMAKVTKIEYYSFGNKKEVEKQLKSFAMRIEASCEVNCDRERGCYDKPTEGGVLLCAFECLMICGSK